MNKIDTYIKAIKYAYNLAKSICVVEGEHIFNGSNPLYYWDSQNLKRVSYLGIGKTDYVPGQASFTTATNVNGTTLCFRSEEDALKFKEKMEEKGYFYLFIQGLPEVIRKERRKKTF